MSKLRLLLGLLSILLVGAAAAPWASAEGASLLSWPRRLLSSVGVGSDGPSLREPARARVDDPRAASAHSAKVLAGPVEAQVTRIVDGDTLEVAARTWIEEERRMLVRLTGINAPEIHTRCAEEKAAGEASRQALARIVGGVGAWVSLRDIRNDKYGGRVQARVFVGKDKDVSEALLREGFAVAYHGGRRVSACAR